jgi:hypothetical protein
MESLPSIPDDGAGDTPCGTLRDQRYTIWQAIAGGTADESAGSC